MTTLLTLLGGFAIFGTGVFFGMLIEKTGILED